MSPSSSEAQAETTGGRACQYGRWKPGALQNDSIDFVVAFWQSGGGPPWVGTKEKGSLGQTLKSGLSFLSVSLSKITRYRQPRL